MSCQCVLGAVFMLRESMHDRSHSGTQRHLPPTIKGSLTTVSPIPPYLVNTEQLESLYVPIVLDPSLSDS